MKYFTFDWWLQCQDPGADIDLDKPCRDYQAYFETIRGRLPRSLMTFLNSFSLHDASLNRLRIEKDRLELSLLVARIGPVSREEVRLKVLRPTNSPPV